MGLDRFYVTAPIFDWVEASRSTPTQQLGFGHDMITICVVDQDFVKEEKPKQTCVLPEVLETQQYSTKNVEAILTGVECVRRAAKKESQRLKLDPGSQYVACLSGEVTSRKCITHLFKR